MKVKSSQQKGRRIFKSYPRPMFITIEQFEYNFVPELDKWMSYDEMDSIQEFYKNHSTSNSYYAVTYHALKDCYSLKSALRKIRKWNMPKGTVFNVGLTWVGHDFKVTV